MPANGLHATLGRTGIPVFRLGVAASYRPGERAIRRALDEGVNYLFCYGFDSQMIRVVRSMTADARQKAVVATGAYSYLWFHQDLRKTLEKRLRQLRADYIDVFHFLGALRDSQLDAKVRDDLAALREDPRVRAVSVSCHNHELSARLAAEGAVDCLMTRYNAAHRGAESTVFPEVQRHGIGSITFTATRWSFLARRTKGWPQSRPIPSAGDCYRFALSHPAVDVCLTAPTSERQLIDNLAAVRRGPLDEDELAWMRDYGAQVERNAGFFL